MALKLTGNQKDKLIDEVIEQIKYDILIGDVTAIDELLRFVPDINLVGYLPDDVEANARYNPNKETGEPTDAEIEEFKRYWGQTDNEIRVNLELEEENLDDELLMDDYFWIPNDEIWCNKHASTFTARDQEIADFLIKSLSRID